MHLHGHDFLLLADGKGVFDENVLASAKFLNPTRRDVVTMPASDPNSNVAGGFIVIAFPLDSVPNCGPCPHGHLRRTTPLSGPNPPQNATSVSRPSVGVVAKETFPN